MESLKFLVTLISILLSINQISASSYDYDKKQKNLNGLFAHIQDPRKNTSYFDIHIKENVKYGSVIGYVREILIEKNLINPTNLINNYKLIYYSPQLIPSINFQTNSNSNDNSSAQYSSEPLFSVDNNDGSIQMKTPNEPTLEHLCMKRNYCACFSCIIALNVIYSTENKINAVTIRVFIDDKNEQAPVFYSDESTFTVNISESSQIGDYFTLNNAAAYDTDAFYNQVSYYISDRDISSPNDMSEQRSNLFEVSALDVESKSLNLVLKTHLDYETSKQYEVYLIAKDNGPSANVLKSSKRLIVNVLDENDNSPVCEKSLFIENVNENKAHKYFLQIRANDLDSGMNALLQYSIMSDAKEENGQLFEIEKYTGWLSIKQPLDYEKKSHYELMIKVNDSNANNSFSTYCTARINIIDLNDNPAKMKIIKYLNESVQKGYYALNTMSPDMNNEHESNEQVDVKLRSELNNQIELYENNQADLVLALIRVFDSDTLSNYKFLIQSSTQSQEDISMFRIRMSDRSNREFELYTTKAIDSDFIQNYRLKITLFDLDEKQANTTKLMLDKRPLRLNSQNNFEIVLFERIKLLDLNDNKPQFLKKAYEFTVVENKFNMSINEMKSIEVFDLDSSSLYSRLNFRILDKDNLTNYAHNYIYVNEENNNYPSLFLIKPLDFETHGKQFEFNLLAYDNENNTDVANVVLKIQDLNDNPPIFTNENSTFYVKENTPINGFVGQVIATDKDSIGLNSDISYRILNEDQTQNVFKVYKSGMISTRSVLDREMQDFYSLKVQAYDYGDPSLSSIATFYVQIVDENDNEPCFVHPAPGTKHMQLKLPTYKHMPNRIKLFDVKAMDKDFGDNGKLVYKIDDSKRLLEVDSSNGSVFLNTLSYQLKNTSEIKEVLDVYLSIADSGSPSLNTSMNFTFYLNYDMHELPIEVINSIRNVSNSNDFPFIHNRKFDSSNFDMRRNSNTLLYRTVSNSVLIIILMAVLLFMILVTCFIFVTIYKRIKNKKKSNKSKKSNLAQSSINTTYNSNYDFSASSSQMQKCIDQVKVYLKTHCNLSKASSFKSIKDIEPHLTVKDASTAEINPNMPRLDSVLASNSFKITVKRMALNNSNNNSNEQKSPQKSKSKEHSTEINDKTLLKLDSCNNTMSCATIQNEISEEIYNTELESNSLTDLNRIKTNNMNNSSDKTSSTSATCSSEGTTQALNVVSDQFHANLNYTKLESITCANNVINNNSNQNPNLSSIQNENPFVQRQISREIYGVCDVFNKSSFVETYCPNKLPTQQQSLFDSNSFIQTTSENFYDPSFKCKITSYSTNQNSVRQMCQNAQRNEIIVKDDIVQSADLMKHYARNFDPFSNVNFPHQPQQQQQQQHHHQYQQRFQS